MSIRAPAQLALCVGGTSLTSTSTRREMLTAHTSRRGGIIALWAMPPIGAGGGISSLIATPTFQSANGVNFGARAVPDVSALADEYTGFAVTWDRLLVEGNPGGYVIGGTTWRRR